MASDFKNLPLQYLQSNPNKLNGQACQIYPISPQTELTIGRSHENSLQILDNTISKKHAKIANLKNGYYLYDLSSGNGVYVNGEKVDGSGKLQDGDSIQFGKFTSLYKFVDRGAGKNRSKGKGRINLKDYMFEDNGQPGPNMKSHIAEDVGESVMTQPKSPHKVAMASDQPLPARKKVKPKQSKIRIPDLSDYLRLAETGNQEMQNNETVMEEKYTRSRAKDMPVKQGRVKLRSMEEQVPTDDDLKEFNLDKRERNIFIQEQQALEAIEKQRRKVEEQKLKRQLEQAKIAEDLLQKQLIMEQRVREEQQKIQKEKEKLEQQFVKREQVKREQELKRLKSMEEKQRQMMTKIEEERERQLQELKNKEEIMKQESQNLYKKEYEKRKKDLELQAEALARQYENIYRETIKKVRSQIDNEESTIQKMQQKQNQLKQQSESLTEQIARLKQETSKLKNQFIAISGRNKACILYASDIQDKIDGLGAKQFRQNQEGYYKSQAKSGAVRKLEEAVSNSRKLLKLKDKQYEKMMEEIGALTASVKQKEYASSSDVSDYLDTITENLQLISNLKKEYLELIQSGRAVEQVWEAELNENTELESRNKVLENEIAKNAREIDENSRDQIKKSTQQRLHMLKIMHFCPEQKKSAAKFLIEQMLNIQQDIHKFRNGNEEMHKKIGTIITQTERLKRQNQYLSEILFSQDESGHHFDNMKIVINNLIEKIGQEKGYDNVSDLIQITNEATKYQLMIQEQIERRKKLRENMRKIGQMGLAPVQVKARQKNPITFFGDMLTAKQIQIEKRKSTISSLENQANTIKAEMKLLVDKKQKISQALQKYKYQQLSEARKYLGKSSS